MPATPTYRRRRHTDARRLWAILAVAFGVSLSVIDSTIANVALPTISRALGISSADSIWIVNAYQLAIMVSLLSFSALGDLIGYRKVTSAVWRSSPPPRWAAPSRSRSEHSSPAASSRASAPPP